MHSDGSSATEPDAKKAKLSFKYHRTPHVESRMMEIFPEGNYVRYKDFTPVEMFNPFFDDEVIELMLTQSILYARSKNDDIDLSSADMHLFLGVLIVSGVSPRAQRWMY